MPEFVPSDYISMREALNHLGRELFPSKWTGEEHLARRSLIGADEWLKIKDLPPAHGGGADAPDAGRRRPADNLPSDPSSPAYQAEYEASQRYTSARGLLRASLERGDLDAAILDPFTGILHPVSASLWRQHGAARVIERGQAPIPGSPKSGSPREMRLKPMPRAKIQDGGREKSCAQNPSVERVSDFLFC
jgi:hypothetical protein